MKRTVFISSTFADLIPERKAVWDLLGDFKVDIRGMENFGARTDTPLRTCLAEVDTSDIYIGIIALRLGSVDRRTGKSFTQLEYEQAYKNKKEILIYLLDEEKAQISPKNIDYGEKHDKLISFKKVLKKRHTVSFYKSATDLTEKLRIDFKRLLQTKSDRTTPYDSFEKTKNVLDRFFLLPKDTSGTEVRVKLKVIDKPFSASKLICEAFNFDFGSTIGITTQMINPNGYKDFGLEQLYIDAKQAEHFINCDADDVFDIWVRLQFADMQDVQDRAQFYRNIEYHEPTQIESLGATTEIINRMFIPQEVVHEPDGKIVMVFTRIFQE